MSYATLLLKLINFVNYFMIMSKDSAISFMSVMWKKMMKVIFHAAHATY